MRLKINGTIQEIERAGNVEDVLANLGYQDRFVAVALNRDCVSRRDFATTAVREGDELEVLAPMAGG